MSIISTIIVFGFIFAVYLMISMMVFDIDNPKYSDKFEIDSNGDLITNTHKNPDPTTKDVRKSLMWPYYFCLSIVKTTLEIFTKLLNIIKVLLGIDKTLKR